MTFLDLFAEPTPPKPEEQDHVLIVSSDLEDEDDVFEVIHPLSCPEEEYDLFGIQSVRHACLVEFIIEQEGVEGSFTRRGTVDPFYRLEVLDPGIYLIRAWEETYRNYEYGEEYESGLEVVVPKNYLCLDTL